MQACLFIIKLSFVKTLLEAKQVYCVPMLKCIKNRISACVDVQVRYCEKNIFVTQLLRLLYTSCGIGQFNDKMIKRVAKHKPPFYIIIVYVAVFYDCYNPSNPVLSQQQ